MTGEETDEDVSARASANNKEERIGWKHYRQHSFATAALCVASFANGYLMISLFPYAGYMALTLLPNQATTRENVGVYAGILSSAFMGGRLATAYMWGHAADLYGRVGILQATLMLSATFSLFFGCSTSFTMAVVWRVALGAVNGIVSTSKTAAQEIACGQAALQRRTMGLVIGMRSWSMLCSPAVAGFLAEPLQQYTVWARRCQENWPVIYSLLQQYPFLVPNLLAAILCCVAAVAVGVWVPETLEERRDVLADLAIWWHQCSCSWFCCRPMKLPSPTHAERKLLQPQKKSTTYTTSTTITTTITKETTTTTTTAQPSFLTYDG